MLTVTVVWADWPLASVARIVKSLLPDAKGEGLTSRKPGAATRGDEANNEAFESATTLNRRPRAVGLLKDACQRDNLHRAAWRDNNRRQRLDGQPGCRQQPSAFQRLKQQSPLAGGAAGRIPAASLRHPRLREPRNQPLTKRFEVISHVASVHISVVGGRLARRPVRTSQEMNADNSAPGWEETLIAIESLSLSRMSSQVASIAEGKIDLKASKKEPLATAA